MFEWLNALLGRAVSQRELHQNLCAAPSLHQSFDRKLSFRVLLAIRCTTMLALTIVVPTYREAKSRIPRYGSLSWQYLDIICQTLVRLSRL